MQYAQLKAQQNAQLQNSIGSGLDNAYKNKTLKVEAEKAKTAGLDLDKLAVPALIKMQAGQELDPQETAILKAWDLSETRKLAPDASGNYRKVNASIFDGGAPQGFDLGNLAKTPGFVPSNVQANVESQALPDSFAGGTAQIPAVSDEEFGNYPVLPVALPNGPLDMSMLQGASGQDALPEVPKQAGGFDTGLVAPVEARPPITVPPELAGNPNAAQKYLESAAGAEATAATDVKKAVDIKKGEAALTRQQKLTSIDGALGQMGDILEIAKDTPSGTLDSFAATVANKAGYPTKKSNAQADFAPRVTLLTTQVKNFIRSPGEGTFTDADQKLLNSMLPEDDDSVPTKITKLKAIQQEFQRIRDGQSGQKTPTNRGFKYLGMEK